MVGGIAVGTARQELTTTTAEELSDEDLLAQFLDAEAVASQDAFRLLVARHGLRILRICRHVLNQEHDAEDAFQATFLALARNGASIRERCALASWLHEVAYRTALKTRARRSRRQTVEREILATKPPRDEPDDQGDRASLSELRPMLHEEVTGLPDKYRIPVVLSYLEGKTNEEVAAILKWPVGTVKGRLSRGRALLRSRLTRRGIALSMASLIVALSQKQAAAAIPEALIDSTLRRVLRFRIRMASADSPGDVTRPEASPPDTSASPGAESSDAAASTASPAQRLSSPSSHDGADVGFWRLDRLISAGLVVLTFIAALFVGGCVSSAAHGGQFPNLRSAFSGLMPAPRAIAPHACSSESIR